MTAPVAPDARPRRGRPATAAARILEATERLLDQGERYADLPVERVLEEANVSRSSFYTHFADKGALLVALAEATMDEITASGAMWWQSTHSLGPEPAAETVLDLIRVYRKHSWLIRAVAEATAYDPAIDALWRERREAFATFVALGIREEQKQGFVRAELDVERTASYVTLLVDQAVLDHIRHGNKRDDRQVAAALGRMGWLAYYGEFPA
ncbi:MAG TPA: TetR/AcrR family transcriptional regulator [Nocardioidaceae bacterium]|nr:TetR/AcrR family transcriptional regulator [Nocardioidaceae bacterium]